MCFLKTGESLGEASGIKKIDSLVFKLSGKDSMIQKIVKPVRPKLDSLEIKFSHSRVIDFLDTLSLKSSLPIISINDAFIEIRDLDSLLVPFKSVLNKNKNQVFLDFEKTPNNSYSIKILPNATVDFWGDTNDSIETKLNTKKIEDYGVIILSVKTDEDFNYFIELLDKKGETVRKTKRNENNRYRFSHLTPGTYGFRLIKDLNNNQKWDTGNYLKKIQPEEVFYMDGEIVLRANWDQNEVFIVK